ncbi:MAG: zf-HC2 domain-containing protein [Actinobacteria bacterium]|nr:zf-HC2 domain-containing protein [Actinomycetota bacterium]
MNADPRCTEIRTELSARLDDEVDRDTSMALDAHLETCADCRDYEDALRSVKRSVALGAAPRVRDLVPDVMARVSRDVSERRRERRSLVRTAVAAAVITTLVLSGALLPWRSEPDIAIASEITRAVQSAASEVGSYHAEFDIRERGWNDDIAERHFTAEIWFSAPERLRMEVRDLTPYPGPGWPSNDATLVATPDTWWLRETASCPAPALPGCAVPPEPEIRALRNRQPFDGSTALPTDLVLPLETLADTEGLSVVGRDVLRDRDAHHVVLQQWQAAPLLESLQVAGTWREFRPTARVDLWLDTQTWFPLKFVVRGRNAALTVTTTSFEQPTSLAAELFETPPAPDARDGGFRATESTNDLLPTELAGLSPYRSGRTRDGQTVDSFMDGMTWMKITTDDAKRPTLSTIASELVDLGRDRFAYYSPSSDSLRRTIEIFGDDERIRLESNLPRRDLLEVASSVPVDGKAFRQITTSTGSITAIDENALGRVSYALKPAYLPDGFRFSSAFVSRSAIDGSQQTVAYFRRDETAPVPGDIRITQAPDVDVLPPSSEDLRSVVVEPDVAGRWSPARSELEWLDGTDYRAVAVPAFDLDTALRIAKSMRR